MKPSQETSTAVPNTASTGRFGENILQYQSAKWIAGQYAKTDAERKIDHAATQETSDPLKLNPVTFSYKNEPQAPISRFGLIEEDIDDPLVEKAAQEDPVVKYETATKIIYHQGESSSAWRSHVIYNKKDQSYKTVASPWGEGSIGHDAVGLFYSLKETHERQLKYKEMKAKETGN